ncbi:putative transposase/integrase [Nocardioides baekrokdamisoli]|uniref:Putative transposase/integrase n=1 Tax=Nocardioides baekrokdamisoli TaxID=1804624 RepID=A0A3G9IPN1_9ACTN|nr:tyrosine-type recombinase/integrase [Nocardioides baekrokdamisoli]BBH18015.1 putative transposase/integrase [Nocardioides baekrokdamisoli]
MAKVQRVRIGDDEATWTVVDSGGSVIVPAEEFLEYLRNSDYSPNTVRSYARALALWWTFLDDRSRAWDSVPLKEFGTFLNKVRTGALDQSSTMLRPVPIVAESTVAARFRAVASLYRFHASNGVGTSSLLYETVRSRPGAYLPLLEHIARRNGRVRSVVRVREERREVPVLTPTQIDGLLAHEARWDGHAGQWLGDLRYRFLWALLAESGCRIGEALSLRHGDWQSGRGDTASIRFVAAKHPHGIRLKSGARRVFVSAQLDRLYADYVWALCEQGADAVLDDWDNAYIFCNVKRHPLFGPLRPESVYAHLRASIRAGAPVPASTTPHWFRHTHATALLLAGTPVHVVSRRLGHADVQTTLNVYGHVTTDAELAALASWSSFVSPWETRSETV